MRSFGGRLVKTMGDGILLEFPSVVAAVECAIAIQKMMAERNTSIPEARRILYRVGVNLGDILINGEDRRSFEVRAALALAKLYQSTARPAEAHAVLAPALEGFAPTFEMPEMAEAKALLEQCSQHRPRLTETGGIKYAQQGWSGRRR